MSNSIILIDARSDSLTISWPPVTGAVYYLLEYRTTEDDEFSLLADDLLKPTARKYHLSPECDYFFRAAAIFEDDQLGPWMEHEESFHPLDYEDEDYCMAAPRVTSAGEDTLMVAWDDVEDVDGFELQMRECRGGAPWVTIAPELNELEVKKRNLKSSLGYQFRVRPVGGEYEEPWSPPSEPAVARAVNNNKRSNGIKIPVAPYRKAQAKSAAEKAAAPPPRPKPEQPRRHPNAMPAPWIKNAGMKHAVLVCWQEVHGATGYELQIKENSESSVWETVASNLSGTEARKKNLTSYFGYQFRVRANGVRNNPNPPFSPSSPNAIAT